jgi:hypothetical protein
MTAAPPVGAESLLTDPDGARRVPLLDRVKAKPPADAENAGGPPRRCAQLAGRRATRAEAVNGLLCRDRHAVALQDGSIVADNSDQEVELKQGPGAFELDSPRASGRCLQRRDGAKGGAGADAVGNGVSCAGDREGRVRRGLMNVDRHPSNKASVAVGCGRRHGNRSGALPGYRDQIALGAKRICVREGHAVNDTGRGD